MPHKSPARGFIFLTAGNADGIPVAQALSHCLNPAAGYHVFAAVTLPAQLRDIFMGEADTPGSNPAFE